jgi:hypothetical protein
LVSIIKYHKNLTNATPLRAKSGNLPTAIEWTGFASHPEVGLVLTGGQNEDWESLKSVVQTEDGSRFVFSLLSLYIQGVQKVQRVFSEAISRESLGLQKWQRRQKMSLILKFCLVVKNVKYLFFSKVLTIYEEKVFRQDFFFPYAVVRKFF